MSPVNWSAARDSRPAVSVSVLIVTRNRVLALRALLGCLAAQTRPGDEILVVDNASCDGTAEMLAAEFPQVRVLRQERNLGCIEGRNLGLAAAGSDIAVCVDDDATCGPETLARFAAAMEQHPRAAVIAARIVSPDGARETVPETLPPHRVFRFSGGAAALRKAAFLAAGGYAASFQRGVEELDLAWRLWDEGWEIIRDPSIAVQHPVHRKSGPIVRYQTRNEIWTGWRNLPLSPALAWAAWKSVAYPLVYIRRGWAHWAWLGAMEGWLGWWRQRHGRRPVRRETLATYRQVRAEYAALIHRRDAADG